MQTTIGLSVYETSLNRYVKINIYNYRQNLAMNKHRVSETKIKSVISKPQHILNSDRLPILSIKDQFLRQPILTIQKPKSLLSSPIIERSTKNLRLMHEIKPVDSSDSSGYSLEQQRLMKRLQSRKQSKHIPELMILKTNEDKKSYLKRPVIKENLVGDQAIQKFYQIYKQIDRRSQKEDFMNEKHAITKIINLLEIHNFTPKKLTFVKLKGKQAILDLKKLGVGQGSMGPFIVEIVNYLQYFQEIDLSYNRIDGVLGESFIQNLGKVKKIDLSHNRIGKIGCQKISELFIMSKTKIQQLNLQQNNLLDNAGVVLLQQLAQYNNLKKLNLNKNYMGPKFALKLKQFLLKDKEMNELYLSWNEFSFKAIKAILQGVAGNSNLKVFDFSWNKIDDDSIPILFQVFKCHFTLRHADFSFCQIKLQSIPLLAQALKENQILYGLHFEGNSGFIDHRGFLNATEKQFNQYPLPLMKGVIRKIDGIKPNLVNQFKVGNIRDVCWICHSWQQKYFDISYSQELQEQVRTIDGTIECYIHFKHENFWAVRMMLNETVNRFQIARMCPIGNIYYFFTFILSNGARKVVINPQYNSVSEQMTLNYSIGKIEIKETVLSQNKQISEYEVDPLDQFYQPKIHIVPRFSQVRQYMRLQRLNVIQTQKVLAKRKVIREEKVKVSLKNLDEDDDFLKDKQNRDFDEEYLKQCIDFDIENSKIPKVLKQQSKLQEFKSLMVKYYKHFKETFYYLSRSNPAQSGIYSINQLQFGSFLEEQKYITKRVTLPKIMLKLYSCLSAGEDEEIKGNKSETIGKKGDDKSLNKLISRPQFLQFMIRLAIQKWCTFKPVKKKIDVVNIDNLWDLTNKKSSTVQKINQKKGKIPIKIKLQKKQEKIVQKVQVKRQQDQQQQNEMSKLKLKLPLPLMEGIEKTISSLKRYSDNYGSSRWRQQKYLKPDIMIVFKAYQEFLYNLYQKYTEAKFKTNKHKKIMHLLTLEELKTLILDTQIKRTRQAMKQVDQVFLDSKRLEVEDGNLQYGLTLEQFQQCLARLSEMIWFSPIASPNDDLWEQEVNRRNTPLFLRYQSLVVEMYYKLPQLHNKRMDKVVQKGIFQLQIDIIIDKIKRLSQRTVNLGLLRCNSILGEQSISLKDVVDQLREKYDKMVIHREEEEQFFQDAVIQA